MNAGQLDRRITVEQRTEVASGTGRGAKTPTWTELATVWAKVEPLQGREFWSGSAEIVQQIVVFKVRYSATLKTVLPASFRVVYDSQNFDIQSVVNVDARREFIHIRAIRND